ncbi:MAG TPA: beta-ketoacyl synthase N-terminal-like domain-containing protein, partial [Azospirillum sp.]
ALDGVLHVAGISGAAPVLSADPADFQRVLDAKVAGTLVLDRVLSDQAPDFVCYVSSSAAILGDFGSCDYALGNRFQTAYARCRNGLAGPAARAGRTLAVNWPLWRDGGRRVGDDEQTRFYLASSGQRALTSEEGVRLFERLLAQDGPQYLVLAGQPERLSRMVAPPGCEAGAPARAPAAPPAGPEGGEDVEERLARDLKERICQLLKARPEEVHANRNLADLGFDSISLAEFARVLSGFYGLAISPSVFFSHATPKRLAGYFLAEHRAAMDAFYRRAGAAPPVAPAIMPAAVPAPVRSEAPADEPIAIIGMSGRFPKARDVDELWGILERGEDAVGEIAPDRFDWRRYYSDTAGAPGKTISKWCGCIPGLAEFDPLFFEISPLEAERMDPRQRHLLQESWLALENAGYGPAQIAGDRVGMFVGVEDGSDYQRRLKNVPQVSLTATHNGILASRLAYFLNLDGPVMAINTACSSSLVAAHMACQSLLRNECGTAIAAGVNLMVSPEAYVGMSQAGMLSPDGKCYAFDRRANGMVPGEAVAVVVLKRLSRALADGDPIQGVIRGSGVNYDGRTNGITAPSGASQTGLLRGVHRQCGLRPQDIDCVVTHGTGTQLGDAVEINALADAFRDANPPPASCALTSTKSNLGHTFAASGLVSLIGLVQAIRHATIPASLHCEQENDHIHWRQSPFYVNKRAKPWTTQPGRPRTGAVSAFGISGTNAHVVVQEHAAPPAIPAATPAAPCFVLALSGRTAAALRDQIARMLAWLRGAGAEAPLDGVSHTLLHGRHHFEHRCAIVVRDAAEAIALWSRAAAGENPAGVLHGVVVRDFGGEAAVRRSIPALVQRAAACRDTADDHRSALRDLANLHCKGYEIPWHELYARAPRRVSLPGYPFARERHWIDEEPAPVAAPVAAPVPTAAPAGNRLHPLVDREDTAGEKRRFVGAFTGRESFMPRCRHGGEEVIPALFFPEMARFAAERALGRPVLRLGNIVWGAPLASGTADGPTLAVSLHGAGDDIAYSIAREDDDGVCCHLGAVLPPRSGDASDGTPRRANLARLRAGMKPSAMEPGAPPSAVRIGDVYRNASQMLATLERTPDAGGQGGEMPFEPHFINAAWHLIQAMARTGAGGPVLLPFSLRRIEASGPLPDRVVLHLTRRDFADAGLHLFDVAFHDAEGTVRLELRDFALTAAGRPSDIAISPNPGTTAAGASP